MDNGKYLSTGVFHERKNSSGSCAPTNSRESARRFSTSCRCSSGKSWARLWTPEKNCSRLTTLCANLNVPRPERGYWAKLAVGKAPDKPSLPELRAGDQVSWCQGGEFQSSPRPRLIAPLRPGPRVFEIVELGSFSIALANWRRRRRIEEVRPPKACS